MDNAIEGMELARYEQYLERVSEDERAGAREAVQRRQVMALRLQAEQAHVKS